MMIMRQPIANNPGVHALPQNLDVSGDEHMIAAAAALGAFTTGTAGSAGVGGAVAGGAGFGGTGVGATGGYATGDAAYVNGVGSAGSADGKSDTSTKPAEHNA